MFFHIQLTHDIYLAPESLGQDIIEKLKNQVHEEVEGVCIGRYGIVIAVSNIESIGDGLVQDGTGNVCFHIEYTAIVFKPLVNEIAEALVTDVNDAGIFCQVGPLSVFVSRFHFPPELTFSSAEEPCFEGTLRTSNDNQNINEGYLVKIVKDDIVSIRIQGVKQHSQELQVVGSLKGPQLTNRLITRSQNQLENNNLYDEEDDEFGNEDYDNYGYQDDDLSSVGNNNNDMMNM
eukprot:TRINITY_DN2052_c0_g1_i1.p1 TRINITY_DN2052_c0_g1~~TRINITY_DN2052_c0_g1_i1.p1  ORF type:complete len:233 (-),score=83.63 TRINITY_DN2052_c0_g1_i1:77-775(-)